jgi:hypothetical protein
MLMTTKGNGFFSNWPMAGSLSQGHTYDQEKSEQENGNQHSD